jgi:hypothetical protein
MEVKHVDHLLRADCAELENLQKAHRDATRRANTLTEPSRNANVAPSSSSRTALPKLLDTERQLLFDNEGCLKCRRVFVSHRSADCPNDFPNAANYKVLTQAFVDLIKQRVKKPIASITQPSDNAATTSTVNALPVAVVMGSSSAPVAYMPANTSNVIGSGEDSDSSVSPPPAVAAVPRSTSVSAPLALKDDVAPLTVPHMFWRCSTGGAPDSFPHTFDALIDHGSHIVLINEDLVLKLCLKRQTLREPMPVEVAMPDKDSK